MSPLCAQVSTLCCLPHSTTTTTSICLQEVATTSRDRYCLQFTVLLKETNFVFSEPLEPVVCSARVSLRDLTILEDLMADYQEQVHENLCNPASDVTRDNVEALLVEISTGLEAYLAEVLQPLTAALGYV